MQHWEHTTQFIFGGLYASVGLCWLWQCNLCKDTQISQTLWNYDRLETFAHLKGQTTTNSARWNFTFSLSFQMEKNWVQKNSISLKKKSLSVSILWKDSTFYWAKCYLANQLSLLTSSCTFYGMECVSIERILILHMILIHAFYYKVQPVTLKTSTS